MVGKISFIFELDLTLFGPFVVVVVERYVFFFLWVLVDPELVFLQYVKIGLGWE